MRSPLVLTLIPIVLNLSAWIYTFSTFNSNYKTKFSIKKIMIMNLCAGGLGGLVALLQLRVRFKVLWGSAIVGSFLSIIMIYLIIGLLFY